ncbi:hypothetical protein IC575_014840 [Cucumis melo]
MKKKLRDIVAKRCIDFDPKAPRKRRSKRLKSLSIDLATTENGNDGEMNEREGDNIGNKLFVDQSQDSLPVVGNKPPNIRDSLDSTHITPRSPLPSDSLASLALLKLASKGQVSPILDRSQNVVELINVFEPTMQQLPKKRRGPTKIEPIAIEECNKVGITFDQFGQPIEEDSIGLSSFLGPLVREVVPVTLSDWRKLSTRSKEILWTSIQLRYNVKEDWQRKCIFQKMGRLWRAEKSRILSQIQSTSTNEELVKMKPSNIQSMYDWMEFVKEKKSTRLKAKSEKFKSMKEMQLPSTRCKSYTRLAEEMKKSCLDSSPVRRVALREKAHRKEDGNHVNSQVAKTLKVEYLGHIVSGQGLEVDPEKIRSIKQWPVPTNMRELRGFLGLTGYCKRFVQSSIVASLTRLLKLGAFKWNEEAQLAFDKLKEAMMTLPVLALPDFNLPFEVETDASGYGVGAVLIQNKRPIAFFSHNLALRDRAKPVYERELMAVVLVVQRWRRPYLLGRRFVVKTGQRSLKFLLEQRVIQPQYQKWFAKLLGYFFEVIYNSGLENKAVDALSRVTSMVHLNQLTAPALIDLKVIKEEVENDDHLKDIIRRIKGGEEVQKYTLQQDMLQYKGRLVIAKNSTLIPTILYTYHDSVFCGHLGYLRTYKRLTGELFWQGMKGDV